jgi:hypothetical protein
MKRFLLLFFTAFFISPLFGQLNLNLIIAYAPGPVDFQVVITDSISLFTFDLTTDENGVYNDSVPGTPDIWSGGYITFQDCEENPIFAWFGANNGSGLSVASVLPWCGEVAGYGCTDPLALNYDPEANIDDGSCFYAEDCEGSVVEVIINTGSFGNEISWNIVNESGNEIAGAGVYQSDSTFSEYLCLEEGCYVFQMFDSFGDGWNGGSFNLVTDSATLLSGTLTDGQYGAVAFGLNSTNCDSLVAYGCTNPSAINFDPEALIDDGSCQYEAAVNDLCADAIQLEEWMLIDNTNTPNNEGIFGECWNFGSGEGEQSSLWFTFTTPSEPAEIHIQAWSDSSNTLTDTQFGLFEECGGEMIYCDGNGGEGLFSAFHFACGELNPDATYILMVDGWNGDAGTCYLSYEVTQPCDSNVYGCTDPGALNYNPDATVDDGSCEYFECDANTLELQISTLIWGNEISWNIVDESGAEIAGGGNYPNNATIWESICLEDGCYVFEMFDSFGDGWNGATFELILDSIPVISGTLTDGEYGSLPFGVNAEGCGQNEVFGCTDPEAINYDPSATIDDGSCEYDEFECAISFEVIPDSSGANAYTVIPSDNIFDAVEVLWDFGDGNTSTELFPTHVYEDEGPYLLCLYVSFADSIGNTCDISYCQVLSGEIFGGSGVLSGGFVVNIVAPNLLSDGLSDTGNELGVFPNPTDGLVNLVFSDAVKGSSRLRVTDIHGKTVEERFLIDSQNISVDLSHLPQGLYLIGLENSGMSHYTKVVVR